MEKKSWMHNLTAAWVHQGGYNCPLERNNIHAFFCQEVCGLFCTHEAQWLSIHLQPSANWKVVKAVFL